LLCAASHDGVFDLDLRTGALRWSDRHYRQLGLSPSNFAPDHMAFMERVHPDDRDALERKVSAHVAAGTPYATQFRIRHHAGHYLSVETRAKVAYSEEREAVRFVGTMRILEESDEIRRELETTRKLFDSMAQHAPGVVFRYSWSPGKGEKLEYVSQGCRDLLEISASEVERDPDRVWSMVDDECLEQMRKSIKESARSLSVWDQVWCLTVPSGVKKWIHGRGTPELRDDGTVQWHAMCLDITERVAAEQQARESRELRVQLERLESLSQLSGGIAHDFNNLLAVVGVNLEMLEDGRRPEAHPTMIATALKAVERGGELTRRLLSFSKKAKLEPVHLPLGEWIRALHDKVRSQVRDCVDVDVEVDEPLPSIRVDRSALEHAVLNVVRNADESMPEGGALKIAARAGAESVEIVVSDSGVGMSEAVRRRPLEPFFSTPIA
ncbi:MAG: PAS domain-containing protein, partial [Myxococcota bacterium]